MRKQKGFTLVELFITLVFLFIVGAVLVFLGGIAWGAYKAYDNRGVIVEGANNVVTTITTENITSRCVDDFKFVVGDDGRAVQVLDANGKGVPCENIGKPGN